MDLNIIFAWIIAVLAGLACIGALAVVIVAEWYAIRRTIERHRRPGRAELIDPSGRWWREHSHLTVPERRP
jgi:O-antigen ligase